MNITQDFYDALASDYHKLFLDWQGTTEEQALLLDGLFAAHGFDKTARVLDCACGIGTQAIGLAKLGYAVTASDISEGALEQARARAGEAGVSIPFFRGDFRALEQVFSQRFDIVIAMDNALPHLLTDRELDAAVESIVGRLVPGGLFVASIRDYDALLQTKPSYAPPYIHETTGGQRVAFQTWKWTGDIYRLSQYIIEDEDTVSTSRYTCEYRALPRQALTRRLEAAGCRQVRWAFPEETGFYQPMVLGVK